MPEEMTRPALGHAHEGEQPMYPATHQAIIHRPAIRLQEYHVIRHRQRPPGPDLRQVPRQPGEGPRTSRNVAILAAFAFTDPDNPALGIKIRQAQAAGLGAPQAGSCQEFQEGPISHAFQARVPSSFHPLSQERHGRG